LIDSFHNAAKRTVASFHQLAGEQASAIGCGFHQNPPDVVNAIEPFISGSDIDKGSRWNDALASNLQTSSCAIVCLAHA